MGSTDFLSSLRVATRNPKHKTELGEHGRGSSLGGGMECVCSAVVWRHGPWRRGPPGVQSTASLAHPAVDAGEAMTATTPIDAASRPRRSPTTRLRHSRESLSWPPATVDKIALSCLSFSLLERGTPIAERACCTVTVVVGTDASGAAAVKAATSVAPRNPTCGPMV